MLRPITTQGTAAAADTLFSKLARLAGRYAPIGAIVSEATLRRDLSGTPLADLPSHRGGRTVIEGRIASTQNIRRTPEIDFSVPNSARIWNYWLGGKDSLRS
jgi:hypothetical protein